MSSFTAGNRSDGDLAQRPDSGSDRNGYSTALLPSVRRESDRTQRGRTHTRDGSGKWLLGTVQYLVTWLVVAGSVGQSVHSDTRSRHAGDGAHAPATTRLLLIVSRKNTAAEGLDCPSAEAAHATRSTKKVHGLLK